MSVTVLSCILNGYDNLRPPDPQPDARFLCYSDEPQHCPPWEIQPAYLPYGCRSRNSRIPKILAHLHADTEYSLWHDGCFRVQCSLRERVDDWLRDADIALFRHPGRPDIYAEAEFCRQVGIGDADAIDAQVRRYRAAGFPGKPFFAGGIILRRHTPAVERFNELWWSEYLKGPSRDQFALAYAVWESGVRAKVIEGIDILQNPWLSFHFHAAFSDLGDNLRFAAERAKRAARWERLKRLCA